jgi:hypothetical protein
VGKGGGGGGGREREVSGSSPGRAPLGAAHLGDELVELAAGAAAAVHGRGLGLGRRPRRQHAKLRRRVRTVPARAGNRRF